jgi:hypothetical protein
VDVPLLLPPFEDWYCPNCGVSERIAGLPLNASRFHTCPSLHMLTAPLIRANVYAKVEAEERQDYIGHATQARGDDGRPYMAVRTTRDDGDDLAVNAELAHASLGDVHDAQDAAG